MDREAQRPQPTPELTANQGKLRAGGIVLSRGEHTRWLSNPKWSALKTHTSVTVYRWSRLYLGIEFEKEQGGVIRQRMEGAKGRENAVNMVYSQKIIKHTWYEVLHELIQIKKRKENYDNSLPISSFYP